MAAGRARLLDAPDGAYAIATAALAAWTIGAVLVAVMLISTLVSVISLVGHKNGLRPRRA